MKKIYVGTLLLFLVSIGYSQNDKKDYSEAFKLIEVWLESQKDFEQLPGIMAVIVEDQEVLWSGAYGMANQEENVEAQPSTICSICSISKLFTAVAIMKLYDEGKLRLDDRIEELLPWYDLGQKFPDSGPITIRSLLTHSSGLPREADSPYWTGPDFPFPNQQEVREGLKHQETLYPSFTYFQYSNLGLTLLGEVVEEISGMPFDDYITENILEPLNLEDTRTEMPENLYGNELAVGYSAMTRQGTRERINFFQARGIKAAAGFSSTVEDLAKFASWQFRLLDTTGTEILKPSTLKYMQNVHWTDPDWKTGWGLGFSVYQSGGSKWVGHGGSCPGYRSTLQMNPQSKRAYSVIINAGGTNPGKYVRGMHEILEKVKGTTDAEIDGEGIADIDLADYEGYYDLQPWASEAYFSVWEGKLMQISLPSSSPANSMTFYEHIESDTFRRIRDDGELGET